MIQSAERALAIDPDLVFAHSELVSANMFLDRFDAAARAQRASRSIHSLALGYYMALIEHDTGNIERWIADQGFVQPHLLRHAQSLAWLAPDSSRARTLGREAVDATEALGRRETAAIYESAAAVWEALSGNQVNGQGASGEGPEYVECTRRQLCHPASRWPSRGDHTVGIAGDRSRAPISTRYDRFTYVPTLRALAAVARNEPARAIELLQANVPYERAVPPTAFNFFFGSLYPVYVRAHAYAASGQHQQAVAEFQKMLDHRGLMMGDPAGARASWRKPDRWRARASRLPHEPRIRNSCRCGRMLTRTCPSGAGAGRARS